ncbi:MAG: hypothetical protein R2713_14355 [Ilumatobacteraceae bacterium]
MHGNLALCGSLAHVTHEIPFWTSIQPIYHSRHAEVAITAGHLAEVSGGQFRLGLGVSHARHGPTRHLDRQAARRHAALRRGHPGSERPAGALPPIWLATLRDKMLDLAVEVADGGCDLGQRPRGSHMPDAGDPYPSRPSARGVLLANMGADRDRRRSACSTGDPSPHTRRLRRTAELPQLLKAAGYEEEMVAIEAALAAGDREALPGLMTDRWLDDCTISGSPTECDQLEAWFDTGVLPIAVMSSTGGGQLHAIGQLFELFA